MQVCCTAKNHDVCKPFDNKVLAYYKKVSTGFFGKLGDFLIKNN